jgi:hypothetical protein
MTRILTIYFAGKIGKEDWRTRLFGSRAGGCDGAEAFDIDHLVPMDGFNYGGPFFVSCDHGCGHGGATHGVGIEMQYDIDDKGEAIEGSGVEGASDCFGHDVPDDQGRDIRGAVHHLCRERIRRADKVFAFINEADCFGTLTEIGMASAMGKPVSIGLGPNITPELEKELWLVLRCATAGVYRGTPQNVWAQFLSEKLTKRKMARTAARH